MDTNQILYYIKSAVMLVVHSIVNADINLGQSKITPMKSIMEIFIYSKCHLGLCIIQRQRFKSSNNCRDHCIKVPCCNHLILIHHGKCLVSEADIKK